MAGYPQVDSVASVLVACTIIKTGYLMWVKAFRSLIDISF